MIFSLPLELQRYFQLIFIAFQLMSEEQRGYVKATVCAMLLHPGKVSMRIIGCMLSNFQRHKSSVSKMFSKAHFFTRDVAWTSTILICNMAYKQTPINQQGKWLLIFDSTYRSRCGKQLDNMIENHGESTRKRTYAFVWTILITPSGIRIALPALMWLSKQCAKKEHVSHKTQPQLATLALKYLSARLQKAKIDFQLIIVADSGFECKALWELCKKHNENSVYKWTLITSCSADRCLGSNGPKASRRAGEKVHDAIQQAPLSGWRKLNIDSQTGIELRSQKKIRKAGSPCLYNYGQKMLRVADIGDCNVVISYKLKDSSQDERQATVRVLLCNNPDFSSAQIIAYYSCRWEIETFFREQKSDLAFRHFEAINYLSCWRFVDLLTVAFNFLEFYRLTLLESPDFTLVDSQESLRWVRSKGLKELFQRNAFTDNLLWLSERFKTAFGQRRIMKAFESLKMPLKIFQFNK